MKRVVEKKVLFGVCKRCHSLPINYMVYLETDLILFRPFFSNSFHFIRLLTKTVRLYNTHYDQIFISKKKALLGDGIAVSSTIIIV